jgi:magnesium-protoporphyrin O-methyltransferase
MYVEAASAYLRLAQEEAARRGYADRVRFLHGDFLDLAERVPPAEVVVLNRVVCCYPDAERLLTVAAGRSLRCVAMSYPREGWVVRLGDRFENWQRRRRGDPFRTYVHAEGRLHEALRRAGFERAVRRGTPLWRVALYRRLDDA